ncbi:phosphonoacetaldehyde hydrolase [Nitratidesulfovibrio sp.]|uniref:phosphonoacetaldehyde hydrolase n=1 Tax=Nitratidesulfovibrio sp. TaxID=2802297 RepID=UPI003342C213
MDVFIRRNRYRGPVRAVVLDWAGTAVDHGCIGPTAVFVDVFARYGVGVSLAEARAFMGLMKKDHIRGMLGLPGVAAGWRAAHGREAGEGDVDALYAETEPMMVDVVARHAEPVPGLLDTVAALRADGIKVGSSTGYTGPMVEVLTREAARRGYRPDAVFCSTDVPGGRPWPWMCYRNAEALGVHPMEAMVKIGDTMSDIQEGLNAGMWTIGLTRTGNELGMTEAEVAALAPADLAGRLAVIEARFLAEGAHYVAPSIAECPAIIADINRRLAEGELPVPA